MSLVDYASSSDDDESQEDIREPEQKKTIREEEKEKDKSLPLLYNKRSVSSSCQQSASASQSSSVPIEKLPDASLLLNSPSLESHQNSGSDHCSRVAAAMAESASRKREPNGSASTNPRSKYPRGNLPQTRNVPDTIGGVLVPPQLKGRSNVVTEDIGKLFVKTKKTC